MSVELKKHNSEAYKKVVEMYKTMNRAAVIHPTGTGKSYIAIKLIEDNPNSKVLFISSYNPILHQLKENIIQAKDSALLKNLKRITYQKLSRLTMEEIEELNPDIIILDEFHHCGAPIWGEAVQNIISSAPNAKILGLSATPIRYFDGNVDMAEELFEGKIASEISFEQAVEEGILPEFDYISALYAYEDSLTELEKRINEAPVADSKRIEARRLYGELISNLKNNSEVVQNALEKHLKEKNGKYMIFCRNIEDMNKKIDEAQELFSKVNPNMEIYRVSSNKNDIRKNEKTIKKFEKNESTDKLKLMFSVNMLNEGFHLPDVNGVIMMRPTQSPTIYQQQMGRALTVGNAEGKRPVIIDLVDNFDSIRIIEDFTERMKQYEGHPSKPKEDREYNTSKIRMYDYVKGANQIINKIQKLASRDNLTMQEKIDLFKKYLADPLAGGEIIADTVYEGYPIGLYLISIRSDLKTNKNSYNISDEEIKELEDLHLLDKRRMTINEIANRLVDFCNEYPKIWNAGLRRRRYLENYSENERKEIEEKFEIATQYYSYISVRMRKGKVSNEIVEFLKNNKVGRLFGGEIEENFGFENISCTDRCMEKYYSKTPNSTEDERKQAALDWFNKFLNGKEAEYGGNIEEYINEYVHNMASLEHEYLSGKREDEYLITKFDLSEPDFICRDSTYIVFFNDLNFIRANYGRIDIFDGKKLKVATEKILSKISQEDVFILKEQYHFGEPQFYKETTHGLARKLGVVDGTAKRKLRIAFYNIQKEKELREIIEDALIDVDIDIDTREEFVRKYFEDNDIFYSSEPKQLNKETKNELLDTIQKGIEKRKEREELIKYFGYLHKDKQLEVLKKAFGKNEIAKSAIKFIPQRDIEETHKQYGYSEDIKIDDVVGYFGVDLNNKENISLLKQAFEIDGIKEMFIDEAKEIARKKEEKIKAQQEEKRKEEETRQKMLEGLPKENKINIEELDLSSRAFFCLRRYGLTTLADILDMTQEELMEVKNLGRKSYDEVYKKIHSLGYELKDEKEDFQEKNNQEFKKLSVVKYTQEVAIEELDLSVRTFNCLKRSQINTVGDIIKLSEEELAKVNQLGKISYHEVIDKVHSHGFLFVDEIDSSEQSKKDEFAELLTLLKEKYEEREQEKQENQTAQDKLKQEIERINNKEISSTYQVSILESIIEENGDILGEIGELENLKQKREENYYGNNSVR